MLPLPRSTTAVHLERDCRQLLIQWDLHLEVLGEVGQIGLQLDLGDIVGLQVFERRATGTLVQLCWTFQDVPAGAHAIRGLGANVGVVSSDIRALPIVN